MQAAKSQTPLHHRCMLKSEAACRPNTAGRRAANSLDNSCGHHRAECLQRRELCRCGQLSAYGRAGSLQQLVEYMSEQSLLALDPDLFTQAIVQNHFDHAPLAKESTRLSNRIEAASVSTVLCQVLEWVSGTSPSQCTLSTSAKEGAILDEAQQRSLCSSGVRRHDHAGPRASTKHIHTRGAHLAGTVPSYLPLQSG